ncbi:hypothetical protein TNCV_2761611 [Trichonephila clavipes]|nr:hypothetical protein TNCV_2761611 [Trichonephila clavipes]
MRRREGNANCWSSGIQASMIDNCKHFVSKFLFLWRLIRAHHEQLPEFERGRIIELKEGSSANRSIARHMGRSDSAIRGLFSDEFSFQLCPDKHRRRVWGLPGQLADPAFTIAGHTGPQQGVIVWDAISFEATPFWSSLEAHLQLISTSTAF